MKHITLTAIILGLSSGSAMAQTPLGWTGSVSVTGSKTTGNTDTTDLGLGLNLQKEGDVWRHKFHANFDYGRAAGVDNKQRLGLGYQIDRDVSERVYVYGNADYFQDDFGAFAEGYFIGAGVGYKVLTSAPALWDVEAGAGYRSQETQSVTPVTEEEIAARGASNFKYTFNDNVNLYNKSEILWSDSDTYIWNEIGITAQLFGNLAAKASFRVDSHSDVPLGREKTDTITRVGVVYTLK